MPTTHGGTNWPETDYNGHPWASSSFDLTTYDAPEGPRHVLAVADTDPDDSDDTPEGYVEVTIPIDAVRALRDACDRLLLTYGT